MKWCGPRARGRTALVGAALLLLAQPATAFYWYGWPGSGVTPPETLTARPAERLPNAESTPPSIDGVPPDGGVTPTGDPDPKAVPEPGTLLAVGTGLAALGLARTLRRRTVG